MSGLALVSPEGIQGIQLGNLVIAEDGCLWAVLSFTGGKANLAKPMAKWLKRSSTHGGSPAIGFQIVGKPQGIPYSKLFNVLSNLRVNVIDAVAPGGAQ